MPWLSVLMISSCVVFCISIFRYQHWQEMTTQSTLIHFLWRQDTNSYRNNWMLKSMTETSISLLWCSLINIDCDYSISVISEIQFLFNVRGNPLFYLCIHFTHWFSVRSICSLPALQYTFNVFYVFYSSLYHIVDCLYYANNLNQFFIFNQLSISDLYGIWEKEIHPTFLHHWGQNHPSERDPPARLSTRNGMDELHKILTCTVCLLRHLVFCFKAIDGGAACIALANQNRYCMVDMTSGKASIYKALLQFFWHRW